MNSLCVIWQNDYGYTVHALKSVTWLSNVLTMDDEDFPWSASWSLIQLICVSFYKLEK